LPYVFEPVGGGSDLPLTQGGQFIEGFVPVDGGSIDPNLLLFAFGMVGLVVALFGFLAYMKRKEK